LLVFYLLLHIRFVHIDKFEESKENKLEYTTIFNEYSNMVEKELEIFLTRKIPVGFGFFSHEHRLLLVTLMYVRLGF
jgi:hypothetical protein